MFLASLVMRVLGHICRVVSFAVKTRVMGHFVDLNCARRAYCVVVNEKRAVCTVSGIAVDESAIVVGLGSSGVIQLWNRRSGRVDIYINQKLNQCVCIV